MGILSKVAYKEGNRFYSALNYSVIILHSIHAAAYTILQFDATFYIRQLNLDNHFRLP